MKIRKKLIWSIVAVGVIISLSALYAVKRIESSVRPIGQFHGPSLNQIQFIEASLKGAVQESFAYLISGEVAEKKEFLEWAKGFDHEAERFNKIARLQVPGEEKEATLFSEIRRQQKLLVEQASALFEEHETNGSISKTNFLAYEHLIDTIVPVVEALVRLKKLETEKAQRLASNIIYEAEWFLYFLAILAALGSTVGGLIIAQNFARRIEKLKKAAVAIQAGAFETRLHPEGGDELSELGIVLNDMAKGLQDKFIKEQELATIIDANRTMKQEIEERQRAEQKLKESEHRYQDLYDNSPDLCVSVDPHTGKIIQCNQTVASATGYTKEEILGRPIFEMYHTDSLDEAHHAFEIFVKTGEVHNAELQLIKKRWE